LTTSHRCITCILSQSESSRDSSGLCTTIETGNPRYFWIWDSPDLYLVIWTDELECCINRAYLIRLILQLSTHSRDIWSLILMDTNLWRCTTRQKNNKWKKKNNMFHRVKYRLSIMLFLSNMLYEKIGRASCRERVLLAV
jgi:hypothetical protein